MTPKSMAAPLIATIVTALLGGAFWIAGQNAHRLADVHAQLAMLRYAAADAGGAEVERALTLERRVPAIGQSAAADVRDARAASVYWRADYAALTPARDAGGTVTETNPAVLLIAANAMYRANQAAAAADRNEALRRLGAVVKAYADVLKAPASACDAGPQVCKARAQDAAYNYELAIRLRDAAAKAKPTPRGTTARAATTATAPDESDLPAGPTLHGKPGGPPPAVDMNEFKMVIPKSGEERKGAPDAGKGGAKVRKG
jgi:hypothetical protein